MDDACPTPSGGPSTMGPSGLTTPKQTRRRSPELSPPKKARRDTDANASSSTTRASASCSGHSDAPTAGCASTAPSQSGAGSGSQFTAGVLVKIKKNGRTRGSNTYKLLELLEGARWRIQDVRTGQTSDVDASQLAIARPRDRTGASSCAAGEGSKSQARIEIPDDWYKFGVKPWAAFYAHGLEKCACVPFTADAATKLNGDLRHRSIILSRLPPQSMWETAVAGEAQDFTLRAVRTTLNDNASVRSFKIGWTANPCQRIDCYLHSGMYQQMIILWVYLAGSEGRGLSLGHEACLLREFRDHVLNNNDDRESGGECPQRDSGPPYYVYMAISR